MPKGKSLSAGGKYRAVRAALAVCVLAGAAQLADLLLFTERATGFAAVGPAALRYGAWLVLGAACLLLGRLASPRPAALQTACPRLGNCLLATAVLLAVQAAAALPALADGGVPAALDAAAPLLTALWLASFSAQLRRRMPPKTLPGAWQALPAQAAWLWLLLRRFEFAPAAVERLPCTLRVLSASAAVLFAMVLVKVYLVPGLACGRGLLGTGLALFAYAACLELPRALVEALWGMADLQTVTAALSLAAFGVSGAVCGLCTLTPHVPSEEDEKPDKKRKSV